MIDLEPFWQAQHSNSSAWLTGTSWESVKDLYRVTDEDFQDKVCLEIGVGKGFVTRTLAKLAQQLHCCDITPTAFDRLKDLPAQFWATSQLTQIPPAHAVLCHLVLIHCDDSECVRILKSTNLLPDGRIFCQLASFKDSKVGISDATPHTQNILDLGVKHFFRDVEEIRDLVSRAGLKIHNIRQVDPGSFHGWKGQFWQLLELRR